MEPKGAAFEQASGHSNNFSTLLHRQNICTHCMHACYMVCVSPISYNYTMYNTYFCNGAKCSLLSNRLYAHYILVHMNEHWETTALNSHVSAW